MIWVVWRQHRLECLIVGIMLVMLAVFFLVNGISLVQTSQQIGLTACLAQANHNICSGFEQTFLKQYWYLATFTNSINLLPLLFGLLVGAPLVARELEQGIHRLIWTQSITRLHWLNVKLALILGVSILAFGLLLVMLTTWYRPIAQFNGSFGSTAFDITGPVFLASVLLALSLGVFAGALTRHTVMAMLVALVLLMAIRLPVEFLLRPNYQPAITITWPLYQKEPANLSDQDWTIATGWVDAQGNKVSRVHCSGLQPIEQCLEADGFHSNYLSYQPADRFWLFQSIETGIYLALTILAVGATVWLVQRRLN
jgi:hypothetical protein